MMLFLLSGVPVFVAVCDVAYVGGVGVFAVVCIGCVVVLLVLVSTSLIS